MPRFGKERTHQRTFENQMRMCRCCTNGAYSNWILKREGKRERLSSSVNCASVPVSSAVSRIAASSFYRTSVIHLRALSTPLGNTEAAQARAGPPAAGR